MSPLMRTLILWNPQMFYEVSPIWTFSLSVSSGLVLAVVGYLTGRRVQRRKGTSSNQAIRSDTGAAGDR